MIRNLLFCLAIAAAAPAAAQPAVPSPTSVLGFPVGADFKLATYDESLRYFRALARASDRIRLVDVGKTSTGGEWVLAIISSPANLARLDGLRAISQRLAHPAGPEVEELLRYANAVAALNCREVGAQTAAPTAAEVDALLRS